jgi:cystathionine beta-lyase/cystathionine gamma-synthase
MKIDTQLIHSGEPDQKIEGAVCLPIFQTSNYEYVETSSYDQIKYTRLNNSPNHVALHEKLKAIEGGEDALVLASGMAAISTALLALLEPGDHVIAQKTLYGTTFSFLTHDLKRFGITLDLVDAGDPQSWAKALKPKTRMFYVETVSNPLMEVPALAEVAAFAKQHGIYSVIDNTFTSPINFKPLKHGFDVSLHSASKYLNGHSDLIAGAVIGRAALMKKIHTLAHHLGGTLDPHACFLLHRGMKTLGVRVERHNQNAQKVAEFLAGHPDVARVHYPGLATHPSHARAKKYLEGFGGMMSFELKGDTARTLKFLKKVKLPLLAASLGGVESLMILPAQSSHKILSPAERQAAGISDQLIRFSVGLEDADDLIEDLKQALS